MEDELTPQESDKVLQSENEEHALTEMESIRNEYNHRDRGAEFEQLDREGKDFSINDPIVKPGQQVYVNDRQIITGQDLIDALVDAYGNEPRLYGFEVYENDNKELPQNDRDAHDESTDIER